MENQISEKVIRSIIYIYIYPFAYVRIFATVSVGLRRFLIPLCPSWISIGHIFLSSSLFSSFFASFREGEKIILSS